MSGPKLLCFRESLVAAEMHTLPLISNQETWLLLRWDHARSDADSLSQILFVKI
jgi:hypothetical protein